MTWVITRLCRDCVDQSCVDVCPVDCIYEYTGNDGETFPNQDCRDEFRVPEVEEKPRPTPEQIAANKEKWGLAG